MSETKPTSDELVDCPICQGGKAHKIVYKKINNHMIKMQKADPTLRHLHTCKFNPLHVVPKKDLQEHQVSCSFNPDYKPFAITESVELIAPVIHHNFHGGTSWDEHAQQDNMGWDDGHCYNGDEWSWRAEVRKVTETDAFNFNHLIM